MSEKIYRVLLRLYPAQFRESSSGTRSWHPAFALQELSW
jgi:hypothetical protein